MDYSNNHALFRGVLLILLAAALIAYGVIGVNVTESLMGIV